MKVTLIVNPISGRGRGGEAARRLREGLEARGAAVETLLTRSKGEARALAAGLNGETSLVVGIGGDGTLNEIANGLGDRPVPLGVVPTGTSNVLAMDLGLPRRVEEAIPALLAGRTRAIDVARVNGRLAILFVGVGFDAMVLERLERRRRGAITKWTYLPAIARALARYRGPDLRVDVDGERFEGIALALVSNVGRYGGPFFRLDPTREVNDGLFECYLFRGRSRAALVRHGLRAMARRLRPGRSLAVRRARRVRIESDASVPYQVDGDLAGTTPVEIEVLPRALRLVIPA
ncbi:MAG TPA: diacylglycerol kinase family protein [Planctomycetota bacterium]|jgi:YegS/Rv2252/BmrU family lipid kinase|nr:diacylglycerol kinase family protein [Planctomycetota bacterium]